MEKQIRDDIKKIDAPGVRILLYCLLIAVVVLFWMYESKDNSIKADYGRNQIECDSMQRVYEEKLEAKQSVIDSLRAGTISDLRKFIKHQQMLNKTLKSKLK